MWTQHGLLPMLLQASFEDVDEYGGCGILAKCVLAFAFGTYVLLYAFIRVEKKLASWVQMVAKPTHNNSSSSSGINYKKHTGNNVHEEL